MLICEKLYETKMMKGLANDFPIRRSFGVKYYVPR